MASAVILAGGRGERFWPMTHAAFPKYRIRFAGKKSLLEKTVARLSSFYPKDRIHVVTTQADASLIRRELPRFPKANIFIEPARKNTGPAIYLSTAILAKRHGAQEVVSFFPADHLIEKKALFKKTISQAVRLAAGKEVLVTVGIRPDHPATGYGYIEIGKKLEGFKNSFRVKRFVEKPDLKTARHYLKRGNFLWNGGIFTWRAGVFLETLKKTAPVLYKNLDLSNVKKSYEKLPAISIDYALLEKTSNLTVVGTVMDWCDLGSWDMLWQKSPGNGQGNYAEGVLAHRDTRGSLLINQDTRPLITLGVSDLVVVQTPRGTLVCRRGRSEEAALLFREL